MGLRSLRRVAKCWRCYRHTECFVICSPVIKDLFFTQLKISVKEHLHCHLHVKCYSLWKNSILCCINIHAAVIFVCQNFFLCHLLCHNLNFTNILPQTKECTITKTVFMNALNKNVIRAKCCQKCCQWSKYCFQLHVKVRYNAWLIHEG